MDIKIGDEDGYIVRNVEKEEDSTNEEVHYIHGNDGSTVMLITNDNGHSYLTSAVAVASEDTSVQEHIVPVVDELSARIADQPPTQFVLTLSSEGQLIATPASVSTQQYFTVENDENTIVALPLEAVTSSTTNDPITNTEETFIQEETSLKIQQDKDYCANCYVKLRCNPVGKNGNGKFIKKFKDPLFSSPLKKFNEEMKVLDALELLFCVDEKAKLSAIAFDTDYALCSKCITILYKLQSVFTDFLRLAKSPSFLSNIFSLSNAFVPYLVKNSSEEDGNDSQPKDAGISSKKQKHSEVSKSLEDPRLTNHESNLKPGKAHAKLKTEDTTTTTNEDFATRLPRSCKKRKNYRTLNNGEMYKSDEDEDESILDEALEKEEDIGHPKEEETMEDSEFGSVPLKKRKLRLIQLKKRLAEMSSTGMVSDCAEADEDDHKDPGLVHDKKSETEIMLGSSAGEVKRESETKRRMYSCDNCCETFTEDDLLNHHRKFHEINEETHKCENCDGIFNSSGSLNAHVKVSHLKPRKRIKRRTTKAHLIEKQKRHFKCSLCSSTFFRKCHLKSHLQNHHGVQKDVTQTFPCPICPRKCITDAALQTHLVKKHLVLTREKKNACEECGRKFLKKGDLINHITTHTNIRKYICEICGFGSKRPQDLTRHRKLVHLKEIRHTCSTCGKGFLTLWQLKSHQLTHDRRKTFPCPEVGCGKSFRCPNNLRQHIHVHQGIKHICHYCGESYSRISYLHRHVKLNHLSEPSSDLQKKTRSIVASKGRRKTEQEIHVQALHEGADTIELVDDSFVTVVSSEAHVDELNTLQKETNTSCGRKRFQVLGNTTIEVIEDEGNEIGETIELDLSSLSSTGVDGNDGTQVILHGLTDDDDVNYEGVIMEYIIA